MTVNENQKKILQMLADGKISIEEASQLLSLINDEHSSEAKRAADMHETKSSPKYLYVRVEPKQGRSYDAEHKINHSIAEHGRVNIRIPMGLIRAGIKLKALIPPKAVDDINKALNNKGISFDFRDLKDEYLENLITALGESEINVDSEEAEVRIHAE